MLDRIKILWASEPALVTTALVAIVVFIAAKAGIVLDQQNVGEALAAVLPILLGGVAVRQNVSPAAPTNVGPDSDALLPADAIDHIDTAEVS